MAFGNRAARKPATPPARSPAPTRSYIADGILVDVLSVDPVTHTARVRIPETEAAVTIRITEEKARHQGKIAEGDTFLGNKIDARMAEAFQYDEAQGEKPARVLLESVNIGTHIPANSTWAAHQSAVKAAFAEASQSKKVLETSWIVNAYEEPKMRHGILSVRGFFDKAEGEMRFTEVRAWRPAAVDPGNKKDLAALKEEIELHNVTAKAQDHNKHLPELAILPRVTVGDEVVYVGPVLSYLKDESGESGHVVNAKDMDDALAYYQDILKQYPGTSLDLCVAEAIMATRSDKLKGVSAKAGGRGEALVASLLVKPGQTPDKEDKSPYQQMGVVGTVFISRGKLDTRRNRRIDTSTLATRVFITSGPRPGPMVVPLVTMITKANGEICKASCFVVKPPQKPVAAPASQSTAAPNTEARAPEPVNNDPFGDPEDPGYAVDSNEGPR